jgi:hypothetical protein
MHGMISVMLHDQVIDERHVFLRVKSMIRTPSVISLVGWRRCSGRLAHRSQQQRFHPINSLKQRLHVVRLQLLALFGRRRR